MSLLRRPAVLFSIALTVIAGMYMAFVADRAFALLATGEAAGVGLGGALLVLPVIGGWWLVHEWRLGTTVQVMATQLEEQGRLPIHDGETLPSGKLTPAAADAVFEVARRGTEAAPTDWAAWFHVAYAYEANRDRQMARKSLRHAADLFRAQRRELRRGR